MSTARPAVDVLGKDFTFPQHIEGAPQKFSDFTDLKIGTFETSDHTTLAYWEAGSGQPLVLTPGWRAHGGTYFYLLHMLSRHYHVYVLDPRNQGLSQYTGNGCRISRYSADLKEFLDHAGITSAHFCGWSMGCSVIWSYIDLFGTGAVQKVAFIDQSPSIYNHADWSEQERRDAGAFVTSVERTIEDFTHLRSPNTLIANFHQFEYFARMDSPYFANMAALIQNVVPPGDPNLGSAILFDHMTNDWRDVIKTKIDVPAAVFVGELSDFVDGERWIHSAIPDSRLFVYTEEEQGDHFLAFKNPVKFAEDLHAFLQD